MVDEVEYFILDTNFSPRSVKDDISLWIDWHVISRHRSLIGEQIFPDNTRVITWFFGAGKCLWETLVLVRGYTIDRSKTCYYDTYVEAYVGHKRMVREVGQSFLEELY